MDSKRLIDTLAERSQRSLQWKTYAYMAGVPILVILFIVKQLHKPVQLHNDNEIRIGKYVLDPIISADTGNVYTAVDQRFLKIQTEQRDSVINMIGDRLKDGYFVRQLTGRFMIDSIMHGRHYDTTLLQAYRIICFKHQQFFILADSIDVAEVMD